MTRTSVSGTGRPTLFGWASKSASSSVVAIAPPSVRP